MHKVLGWAIQRILQLLIMQSNTCLTQCTHIEHMLEGVLIKNIFDIIVEYYGCPPYLQECENEYIWLCLCYDSAYIQADQLLTQLLIDK